MKSNRLVFLVIVAALLLGTLAPALAQGSGLVIWADDTRAPVLRALGTAFEAEFGVPVTVQELGFGDIRDQLKTAAPTGEAADIIVGAHDWLGELVINGLLEPIELSEEEEALFVEVALAAFTLEGVLYGLPTNTENIAFVYNPDIVEEPPTTWEEVYELSVALRDADAGTYGYIRQDGDPYHFFPIQTAFGGYVFGVDENGDYVGEDLGVDNEGSIAAAEWYQRMVEEGLQPSGIGYDEMHSLFESGNAAMIITGPWALERIRESGVNYAVTSIPDGPGGEGRPFLGVQGFMVNAFSTNKLLAQAFLREYVASTDIEVTLEYAVGDLTVEFTGIPMAHMGRGRPSAFLPALAVSEDPDFEAFGEAGAAGQPMPAIPEMSSVWSAWGDALELINQQQLTGAEAFTNAAAQIRTLIGGDS